MKALINSLLPYYEKDEDNFFSIMSIHTGLAVRRAKCANLVSLKNSQRGCRDYWKANSQLIEEKTGMAYIDFSQKEDASLILLYDPVLLEATLRDPYSQAILEDQGYKRDQGLDYYLDKLKNNFEDGCPHEIGIFLDYNKSDVEKFIEQKKTNEKCSSKYCGYWKVYSDVECAIDTFAYFDQIKLEIAKELSTGKNPKDFYLEDKLQVYN